MINVSNDFRQALYNDNRNYVERAVITLEDDTVLDLDNGNIWGGGFGIEDSISSDGSFSALGSATVNTSTLVINNIYDEFSEYDFTNARIVMYVGLDLESGGTTRREMIKKGTYIVDETKYNGSLITISTLDNMCLFDRPYSESNLIYPATADTIVRDACTLCGVNLATLTFPNRNTIIAQRPDDESTTFREVISYICQICGCFAICDPNGELEIKWFDQEAAERIENFVDGGVFDTETPYGTGDSVEGGLFLPWNTADEVDGGLFTDSYNYHNISSLYSSNIAVDDVVITGVRATYKVEDDGNNESIESYMAGSNGYVIEISDNPFITESNVREIVNRLGLQIIGLTFRKASVTHSSDPTIEVGDVAAVVDRKGNIYPILITRTNFAVGSPQTTVCGAETPARKSASRYSQETKNYVEIRKRIKNQATAFERALDDLSTRIDNANGLYETRQQSQGGGYITYLHNKPTIAESDIQIMVSDVGVTVTANGTDPTPTWYGLTVDGTLISNILNTVGINASWINTGQLVIRRNQSEVFFADVDTGIVRISGSSVSITAGDPISTAISTAEQNANSYTDTQVATAGGYTLETPFTWSNNNQTADFTAIVYKGTEDITSTLPASWFTWTLRTEAGESQIGTGKTLSVNKSQLGYGGTITCNFTTYTTAALRSVTGANLKSVDGKQMLLYATQDTDIIVSDLPVKIASQVNLYDTIMGIDNVEGYQVSVENLATRMATGVLDARYVNADGDTMTGTLTISKTSQADTFFYAERTDTNTRVGFGVGNAGVNHGVYSYVLNKWIVNADATNIYVAGMDFTDAASARASISALNKAGDTMTGNLVMEGRYLYCDSSNFTSGTAPSADGYSSSYIAFRDSNDTVIGRVGPYFFASGNQTVALTTQREISGSTISNIIRIGVDSNGNRTVYISESAPWRNALGINNTVSVNTASDVSVDTSTYTSITNSGSLSAGTYVVRGFVSFPSNSTGRRYILIGTSSNSSTSLNNINDMRNAVASATTRSNVFGLITLTAATTLYLTAWQNSGGALSCTGRLEVLKIHD